MWQIPHEHPFAKIKVQSRIQLTAVAVAMVCHNWSWVKTVNFTSDSYVPPLQEI